MPKRFAPWSEIINLWRMIVGAPSVLKTPSMNEAMSFINQLNSEMVSSFQKEKREEKKHSLLPIKKAVSKGEDHKDIEQELSKVKDEITKLTPRLSRLLVNDTTIEKLCELLVENPNGLMVYRDELSGWLASLNL